MMNVAKASFQPARQAKDSVDESSGRKKSNVNTYSPKVCQLVSEKNYVCVEYT